MAYDVYLGGMLLPVTPGKIEMKINGQNKTVTLIDGSEINIIKQPGLTDVSFTCAIPYHQLPYARYKGELIPPAVFQTELERFKTERIPFQFIVSRESPHGDAWHNTNLKVTLEDYTIVEDAEEGPEVQYDIQLKQYRPYGTKEAKIIEPEEPKEEPPKVEPKEERPPSENREITIGSTVIVNGRLHWDSWGSKPGQSRWNYRAKVSHINRSGTHIYHVTTMDGMWLGWVLESAVILADD